MPWGAKDFAAKHNKKLKGAAASKAARMATGMVNEGMDEGKAIRIANAAGDKAMKLRKRGAISDKAAKKHGF